MIPGIKGPSPFTQLFNKQPVQPPVQQPGYGLPQSPGGFNAGGAVNPFKQAPVGQGGDQLDQFRAQWGVGFNPNAMNPPLTPEGTGSKFKAYA